MKQTCKVYHSEVELELYFIKPKKIKYLVAKRIDNPKKFWQMPQGGVDEDEDLFKCCL